MDLQDCCRGLESPKVTERAKSIKQILPLLQNIKILEQINNCETFGWDHIICSTYICLMKDADKYIEDFKKKNSTTVGYELSGRTFFNVICRATKESTNIDFSKLFSYVKTVLSKKIMKQLYSKPCVVTLKDHILCSQRFRSHLTSDDWVELFTLLKDLCAKPDILAEYNYLQVECLELMIKWGPQYSLPPEKLREEFAFIAEVCKTVSSSSLRSYKEIVVKIAYRYCLCTAKDNRLACCKLGEEILMCFIDLYETNAREEKVKMFLIDFFHLLVVLHNPNGVKEGHSAAYANDWGNWKKYLKSIYCRLYDEIEINLKYRVKNTMLFIRREDRQELCKEFIDLFVEVAQQVLNKVDADVSMAASASSGINCQPKRQKCEISFKGLIDNIGSTKKWPWIQIVYSVLEVYPDLISASEYITLLQIISNLQREYEDQEIRNHIYKCLLVLEDIETSIGLSATDKIEVVNLWGGISEATLKEVCLNICCDETEKLLQNLLTRRNFFKSQNLLEVFKPGTVFTKTRIQLLYVYGKYFNFPKNDGNDIKVRLLEMILDIQNLKRIDYYSDHVTAEVLVCLLLKQWPSVRKILFQVSPAKSERKFLDISDIYFKTSFAELLIKDDLLIKENTNFSSLSIDSSTKIPFVDALVNFVRYFENSQDFDIEIAINIAILLKNILGTLFDYGILEEFSQDSALKIQNSLQKLLQQIMSNFITTTQSQTETNIKKLIHFLETFCKFLEETDNDFIVDKVLSWISSDFLRELFKILNNCHSSRKRSDDDLKLQFSLNCMKVVSTYCFISMGKNITQTQKHAFEAIIGFDYEITKEFEYQLVKTFLTTFNKSEPGCLTEHSLLLLLEFIKNICTVRYHLFDDAIDILVSLRAVLTHIKLSKSKECLDYIIKLIPPFYTRRLSYGPQVAVLIIECLEVICQLDSNLGYTKWVEDEEIISSLCDFLCSDFQEVRFAAIKSVSNIFSLEITQHKTYDMLKEVLKRIFQLSLQVFEIQGNVSQERQIDETVTRSGSVLHTFAALAQSNTFWVQESLFCLLRITHMKKLHAVEKITGLLARQFGFNDEGELLENHLGYILQRWLSFGYSIKNFPFRLCNCNTEIEFCGKYLGIVLPILIREDQETLLVISEATPKSLKDILEEYCTAVFSNCVSIEKISNLEALIAESGTLSFLVEHITFPVFKETISERIEEVISFLLEKISDENDFKSCFNISVIFCPSQLETLSIKQFEDVLLFIGKEICGMNNLLVYLTNNKPNKLYHLILDIKQRLEKSKVDKLRMFHSYSLIVALILRDLKENCSFHTFFLRDTIHYLLNLMENYKINPLLSTIASQFLLKVIKEILPRFSSNITQYFHIIVNKLNNMATQFERISNCCVTILKILIIENLNEFTSSIETLDPFPLDDKFNELNTVYSQIKCKNEDIPLEKEIQNFVRYGYQTRFADTRKEGLKHLVKQLSLKKQELKPLFSNLKEMRGFSEDCENSLLHQLICMLVRLGCSSKPDISIEACKCLGEIGPANLSTLILEPSKLTQPQNMSAIEILCGKIISLLLLYILDPNIKLVTAASEGLSQVLSSKEGKKVAKCDEDFGFGAISYNYLIPFLVVSKQKLDNQIKIDENSFISHLNNDQLWSPKTNIPHTDWIENLTCSILEAFPDKCFMPKLVPVCKEKIEFCEELLPYLLHLTIIIGKKQIQQVIYDKLSYFFAEHWKFSIQQDQNLNLTCMNKTSIRTMLNCVSYIRLMDYSNQRQAATNFNLNYLHLAQAAKFCLQHFSAILYTELWCYQKHTDITDKHSKPQKLNEILETVYENVDKTTAETVENILRDSYKKLGEFDALSGCGTSVLLDPLKRVEHFKELGRWDQAVLHHDTEISNKNGPITKLTDSLKHCGIYKLPLLCEQTETSQFECLWRLSQWNVNEPRKSEEITNIDSFDKYRYFALKSLHDNDTHRLKNIIEEARIAEVEKIRNVSLESCRNVYEILARLQSLREIETFIESETSTVEINETLNKWMLQDSIVQNKFSYIEPIKSQRIVILKDLMKSKRCSSSVLVDLMLDLIEYARSEGYLNIATRTLSNIYYLENLTEDMTSKIQLIDAQLCWSLDDKVSAYGVVKQLCNNNNIEPRLRSAALNLMGKWLIETVSENKHTIITDYLLESLKIYGTLNRNSEDVKNVLETYDQLGRFADKQYQHILTHMNSEMFQQKIKNMKRQKQAASEIKGSNSKRKLTIDETRAARVHEQQSRIDEIEIENTEKEKNVFIKFAFKYYLLNLISSDNNNIRIFRIISLFFENRNNTEITDTIKTYLAKVPTYKYVSVLPQMVPHLANTSENLFVEQVNNIILKCAKEHPHHTLPLILSLANSNKDREYSDSTTATATNDSRISSARTLLKKLKHDEILNGIITKMEFLSDALIQLAYHKGSASESSSKKGEFLIPGNCKIRRIKNYSDILLPTHNLTVNKNCKYHDIVGIHRFEDTYQNVGGINAPKRISCRGTDGIVRSQLVKGHDDLRQDAVMQQVFNIINNLLFTSETTKDLLIRTYKVVPLSMRSGILEWVDNSMPIGLYLVGDGKGKRGAHEIYRPQDKTPAQCRNLFKNMSGKTTEDKLQVYSSICKQFKPVFHKFLEHSFPQPSIWYERRRAYIYSVATTSMCGYILGIGDRHVQNILIDKSTAEVIHIDFGIAFEQGRVLPTPETVPFRLTRDMVDGMGVSGVEGIFRKSCEKTLEVMRNNSQTILTILEVLLYDPLYAWTVTSSEAVKRQKDRDVTDDFSSSPTEVDTVNITAERALLRLTSKLNGIEDGYATSLEHQVGNLIQQARDPANLCRLFHGWQPYL